MTGNLVHPWTEQIPSHWISWRETSEHQKKAEIKEQRATEPRAAQSDEGGVRSTRIPGNRFYWTICWSNRAILPIGNILMRTFYRLHHNRRKSHTAQRMAKKQCAASQPGGATHARHSSVQVSRNTLRTLAASIIQCNLPMHVSHYFHQQSQ